MLNADNDTLERLVQTLRTCPAETETIEFKVDNTDPVRIGKYISGLSNAALLNHKDYGYLVWGVEDDEHKIVGTTFDPDSATFNGQPLKIGLSTRLSDTVNYRFSPLTVDGKTIVVLVVGAAAFRPTEFDREAWVRVGSSLTTLKGAGVRYEAQLWSLLGQRSFETLTAKDNLVYEQIFGLLNIGTFYRRTRNLQPNDPEAVISDCVMSGFVRTRDDGRYQITNLGAIALANDLKEFPTLARKALRIVQYAGTDRTTSVRRQDGVRGYAFGFAGILRWLELTLPSKEVYVEGSREYRPMYSELLLRETIANCLIHQDFTVEGAGPQIEIFSDRIEFTNPGTPLPDPDRLINTPPVSRNESLAAAMRGMRLCEEGGTGWDKIATETERQRLPSPKIEVDSGSTRVIIFGPRQLTRMDASDKIRAVYFHACLQWAKREHLTNGSLRERFGISKGNSPQVSKLIRDAVDAGRIVLFDPDVGNKKRSYVPYWVKAENVEAFAEVDFRSDDRSLT